MSHHDFVRSYGRWAGVMVPSASDFEAFDRAQDEAISLTRPNATYAPETPIVIGGQGISLGSSSSLYGAPVVGPRATVSATWGSNGFTLDPPMSRTVLVPLLTGIPGVDDPYGTWVIERHDERGRGLGIRNRRGRTTGNTLTVPLNGYLHNGATLTSVRLRWQAEDRSNLPEFGPTISVTHSGDAAAHVNTFWTAGAPVVTNQVKMSYQSTVSGRPIALLKCVNTGNTGSSLPPFNPVVGTIVPDGTAVWRVEHLFGLVPPADAWHDSRLYLVNTFVGASGKLFKCTVSGISGLFVPDFNVAKGDTVTDGSCTWLCVGSNGTRTVTTLADYRNLRGVSPQPQWLALDPLYNNVIDTSNAYYLRIQDESGVGAGSGNIFYCAELTFENIADTRFA